MRTKTRHISNRAITELVVAFFVIVVIVLIAI